MDTKSNKIYEYQLFSDFTIKGREKNIGGTWESVTDSQPIDELVQGTDQEGRPHAFITPRDKTTQELIGTSLYGLSGSTPEHKLAQGTDSKGKYHAYLFQKDRSVQEIFGFQEGKPTDDFFSYNWRPSNITGIAQGTDKNGKPRAYILKDGCVSILISQEIISLKICEAIDIYTEKKIIPIKACAVLKNRTVAIDDIEVPSN